jgi:DNA-binding NarL/FixJ family response regulator
MSISIFLISDYLLILESIKGLLTKDSDRFKLAGESQTSDEALENAATAKPDIVLLDIDTPSELTPLLITSFIRKHPEIRLILFTGQNDFEPQDKLLLLGARGVINRSISSDLLLTALEKVYQGEIWLDRTSVSRIFMEFVRQMSGDSASYLVTQKLNSLNRREREILSYLMKHQTSPGKLVARQLNISESTLRNNLTSIYGKLEVHNRQGLIAFLNEQKPFTEVSRFLWNVQSGDF